MLVSFKSLDTLPWYSSQSKSILNKPNKVILRIRVSEYLVPETRRHKRTTGLCLESDIHIVSIIQKLGQVSIRQID